MERMYSNRTHNNRNVYTMIWNTMFIERAQKYKLKLSIPQKETAVPCIYGYENGWEPVDEFDDIRDYYILFWQGNQQV